MAQNTKGWNELLTRLGSLSYLLRKSQNSELDETVCRRLHESVLIFATEARLKLPIKCSQSFVEAYPSRIETELRRQILQFVRHLLFNQHSQYRAGPDYQ